MSFFTLFFNSIKSHLMVNFIVSSSITRLTLCPFKGFQFTIRILDFLKIFNSFSGHCSVWQQVLVCPTAIIGCCKLMSYKKRKKIEQTHIYHTNFFAKYRIVVDFGRSAKTIKLNTQVDSSILTMQQAWTFISARRTIIIIFSQLYQNSEEKKTK